MTERIGRIKQIATDRDANMAHHKGGIAGMQDSTLEVSPKQVDDIIERTDIAQADFQARINRLRHDDGAFTEQEIKRARAEVDAILFPRHHPPTPLPIPKQ